MTISNLYLFSKNTDAQPSIRGYQYQVWKTLKTWVYNFINKIDDQIYCDYEEDIFQSHPLEQRVTFRQIKLYSSSPLKEIH
jgi:hypothetical protein